MFRVMILVPLDAQVQFATHIVLGQPKSTPPNALGDPVTTLEDIVKLITVVTFCIRDVNDQVMLPFNE